MTTETEFNISEEPLAERVLRQVRSGQLDESRLLPSAEKRARDVIKKLDRLAARQGWHTFMAGQAYAVDGGSKAATSPPPDPPVFMFHNTGLYNLPGPVPYPADNTGKVRTHRATGGRWPVPRSDPAQRRGDGSLHARRQHRHAQRGVGSLRGGGARSQSAAERIDPTADPA